jgi:hypothetical protein
MEDWKKVLENYISTNLDDIDYEKKSVDFDTDSQTIFVGYRLSKNILLSVSKPYHTLGNDEIGFNLYEFTGEIKELLISDWCTCDFLHTYLKNVQEKIKRS